LDINRIRKIIKLLGKKKAGNKEIVTIKESELIYTDIDNFWKTYDKIRYINDNNKRKKIIQKYYINRATKGFKILIEKDVITADVLNRLLKDTTFYDSIREFSFRAKKNSTTIHKHLNSFTTIYPKARFYKIYFVIGIFKHGGTVINDEIFIGMEFFSKTKEIKQSSLNKKIRNLLIDYSDLIPLILHEQAHVNQNNKRANTLLSKTITEGGADFIMYLQLNSIPPISIPIHEYGIKHEYELWTQFKKDINSEYKNVIKNWFFNYNREDIVPDLGYFIGFRICQNYYINALNKEKALEFLLNEPDHIKILELSNYNGKII